MDKLEIAPIVAPSGIGFPVKTGTWDFIQIMNREIFDTLGRSIIGKNFSGEVFVLWGMTSGSIGGGNTLYTEGAVYYNREIYLVDSQVIATVSNVVLNLDITQYTPVDDLGNPTADPVVFIGAGSNNVHNIRKAKYVVGASGSGTLSGDTKSDYTALKQCGDYLTDGIVFGAVGGFSAVNHGTPYNDVSYRINFNEAFLCGAVDIIIPAPGTFTIFTLPANPSPKKSIVLNPKTTLVNLSSPFVIDNTGALTVSTSGATTGILYLDSINYRLI